jgi:hypothetical protein
LICTGRGILDDQVDTECLLQHIVRCVDVNQSEQGSMKIEGVHMLIESISWCCRKSGVVKTGSLIEGIQEVVLVGHWA